VRRRDGYPPHLPDELRRFVAEPSAFAAWVAEIEGDVVGQVALHPRSSDEVMAFASDAIGEPADRLGVVARLFVAPSARGRGAGGALLSAATAEAVDRGLVPILDVGTHFAPAIALYEKHGWVRLGEVVLRFRDVDLHEFVYVNPS
jgi:GNAT superfamily N-acetyltransferase